MQIVKSNDLELKIFTLLHYKYNLARHLATDLSKEIISLTELHLTNNGVLCDRPIKKDLDFIDLINT